MALTTGEIVAARRFCGYGLSPLVPDALDVVLTGLNTDQEAVVKTQFLPRLVALEAALLDASDNLDTKSAAVWVRNENELAERSVLYRGRRISLCNFLGIPPGPGVYEPVMIVPDPCCKGGASGGTVDPVTGIPFEPAVFII